MRHRSYSPAITPERAKRSPSAALLLAKEPVFGMEVSERVRPTESATSSPATRSEGKAS